MISIYAGITALIGMFLIFAIGLFVLSRSSSDGDAGQVRHNVYRIRKYWMAGGSSPCWSACWPRPCRGHRICEPQRSIRRPS